MAAIYLNTAIQVPIYQINSDNVINRTLYPYGKMMIFGTSGLAAQPNSFNELKDLQAGRQPGGALIYAGITHSAYGSSVFYTSYTVAQIMTQIAS